VLIYGNHVREMAGGEEYTTNQRMELLAAIYALRALKEPCRVKLFSDSAYLVNCFQQGWYRQWRANGWRNSKQEPVQNRELWEELLRLTEIHRVDFLKVKGHAGDKWNERCDALARAAMPGRPGR
jgi:ribonuclease HI